MDKPNLHYIRELSAGDEAFKGRLIAVLKEELPVEMKVFYENMQQGRLQEAAQNVHKIKHKISILNMNDSFFTAEKFEDELNAGRTELLEDFVEILKKMTNFLSQF